MSMHHGCHNTSRIATSELLIRVQGFLVFPGLTLQLVASTMTDWMLSSKESAEAQPPIKQITSIGQLETTAPVPEVADSLLHNSHQSLIPYSVINKEPWYCAMKYQDSHYKNFNQSLDTWLFIIDQVSRLTLHHATWVLTPEAHLNQHLSLLTTPSQLASFLA